MAKQTVQKEGFEVPVLYMNDIRKLKVFGHVIRGAFYLLCMFCHFYSPLPSDDSPETCVCRGTKQLIVSSFDGGDLLVCSSNGLGFTDIVVTIFLSRSSCVDRGAIQYTNGLTV